MKTTTQLIKDKRIDQVCSKLFKPKEGDKRTNRTYVLELLLKRATDRLITHDGAAILQKLGLIDTNRQVTSKGKDYLFAAFIEIEMKRKEMKAFLVTQVQAAMDSIDTIRTMDAQGKQFQNEELTNIFLMMVKEFKFKIDES